MTITSYATLQSEIASWLNRDDLTSQIPTFIQFVEADVNSRLRHQKMVVRAQATSDQEYVSLPADWLEAINIHIIDGKQPLRFVTLDEADRILKQQIITQPSFYSIMDDALEIVPAPATDIDIEMVYYGKIPSLSDTVTSNWLLVKAPDLYLYGALVHASPFLLDDQRVGLFGGMYNSRLDSLQLESDKALHSGGPLVARNRVVFG
jgi:hypothetical protein